MFSQSVIEKLEYYVYLLQDPRTNEIFYIGKGKGNRLFEHVEGAKETDEKIEKLEKIREILNSGNTVKHCIIRHGMTEETAFDVEAALIDFIGLKNLSNIQGGHNSSDFGIKTAEDISAMYEAEELNTDEPSILININKRYD